MIPYFVFSGNPFNSLIHPCFNCPKQLLFVHRLTQGFLNHYGGFQPYPYQENGFPIEYSLLKTSA